ncbi:probable carboxylesterase 17 [Ziziphus jujuba]|uniref:Probable carboxylesterase 17 n=1 Tax=Ziziphus jujuba TaxID=326968 RepID=A0A6P3ZKF0_ZIZJJ|nr:probable carboxylesterase 17 [Ziziphus jujuba]
MRLKRIMATISPDPRLNLPVSKQQKHYPHGVVEEIEGLIRVRRDGHVERPPIIPNVPSTFALESTSILAKDIVIDKAMNLWSRIYIPTTTNTGKLPLLIYFHGGGFCVGSASWRCYHEFLTNLVSKSNCVIISVNYRLAPENRLPAAYEDGYNTLMWVKHQAVSMSNEHQWWLSRCNMSRLFLAGDSAGANIAYHVAIRVGSNIESKVLNPLVLKGIILVQPFFGGESRTGSEKHANQPPNSALTLSTSDTYWGLSLPSGANRDHPWCNPQANGAPKLRDLRLPAILLCVSEMDILKDRNIEFGNALVSVGKKVEVAVCKGVGHAFQVLQSSHLSKSRTQELISHISAFLNV